MAPAYEYCQEKLAKQFSIKFHKLHSNLATKWQQIFFKFLTQNALQHLLLQRLTVKLYLLLFGVALFKPNAACRLACFFYLYIKSLHGHSTEKYNMQTIAPFRPGTKVQLHGRRPCLFCYMLTGLEVIALPMADLSCLLVDIEGSIRREIWKTYDHELVKSELADEWGRC